MRSECCEEVEQRLGYEDHVLANISRSRYVAIYQRNPCTDCISRRLRLTRNVITVTLNYF